jgi:hypothetical protein
LLIDSVAQRDAPPSAFVAYRSPGRGCLTEPLALDHLLAAVLVDKRDRYR